jgi:hypothetical protein
VTVSAGRLSKATNNHQRLNAEVSHQPPAASHLTKPLTPLKTFASGGPGQPRLTGLFSGLALWVLGLGSKKHHGGILRDSILRSKNHHDFPNKKTCAASPRPRSNLFLLSSGELYM